MKTTFSRFRLFVATALLLGHTASAEAQQAAPAKPQAEATRKPTPTEEIKQAFESTVDIRFDQPYAGNDNPKQQLDIFLPKKRVDDKPVPVVVFIHGGGWSGGDRKGYAQPAAFLAASGKYAAISVGYRLSGEKIWPAQIYDCKAAIRWIRAHAKELNIDPERIGATGGSAGGHLVTLLGLTAGNKDLEGDVGEHSGVSSAITCVINFCGPSDLTTPLMQGEAAKKDDPAVVGLIGGSLAEKADVAKAVSPLTYVTKQAVPIMTVHGTADARVNYTNAERLDAALKQAGTVSLLIPMQGAGHGIPTGPELSGRMQQFWDLYLRDVKSEISTAPIVVAPPAPPK
ncbi:MAG: alpha/beta hydrolase [Planctomycetia bacterium]|nr:alpha/beta hydrolase [Planctomycetia bacterium]